MSFCSVREPRLRLLAGGGPRVPWAAQPLAPEKQDAYARCNRDHLRPSRQGGTLVLVRPVVRHHMQEEATHRRFDPRLAARPGAERGLLCEHDAERGRNRQADCAAISLRRPWADVKARAISALTGTE